jgi:hypothetical protein
MAKKSSPYTFVHDSPLERFTPGAPMPSTPPTMPPTKPPGSMVKDDGTAIAAPIPPITENPETPNDAGLFGGASDAPKPSDIKRPINTTPASAAPAKPEIA